MQPPREFTPESIRMLAASVIAQLLGGTMVIGLFPLIMLPASTTLGWSRTEGGIMAGACVVSAALGLPAWGYLVDRWGARRCVLAGTAIMGFAFLALALLTGSLAHGIVSFAFAGFMSSVSVAHVKAQALRFNRHRGVVLAALGMTVGISFGLTPLAGKIVLDAHGWRWVYAGFGLLPLCVSWPILFVWFRGVGSTAVLTDASGTGLPLSGALRQSRFWMIVLIAASSGFVFAGMQAHFVAFLQERNLTSQEAVNVLSVAVFAGLISQLSTGWALDRWRSPRAAMPFIASALLGMMLLWNAGSTSITVAGAILLQSGVGGELSMFPYIVSRTFGMRQMARIFGTVMLIAQVASGGSPVMMGAIHDRTGSYTAALPVFAALLCAGMVLIVLLGRSFPDAGPMPADGALDQR